MNKNLHAARRNKLDEFYTQLVDIEDELKHYRSHFNNKIVLCNCDDPRVSNFYFYFSHNFRRLRLKKLITTCYKNDQFDLFSSNDKEQAICHEYIETDKAKQEKEWLLKGNGDFRSEECIELLKPKDVIAVTNPPFSLFREYVAQLIKYEKKFLIIGHMQALTYKEIFPLIKDNKIWAGYSFNKTMEFGLAPDYEKWDRMEDGIKYGKVPGISWFTNLPHKKRNEELILIKNYKGNEKDYPQYDNYDAIEVNEVVNIPRDYKGVMGVPISFLGKHNPDQFEILGITNTGEENPGIRYKNSPHGRALIKGVEIYRRLLIRRKR